MGWWEVMYLVERETGRLNGLIAHLQHLTLQRIKPHCLDWSHVEEGRVEVVSRTVKEVASRHVEAARPTRILVVMCVDVESRCGYLGRVPGSLVYQHVP